MVLVVKNDLKMGKGKIAAQCSHATLGLYKKLLHRAPKTLNRWEMCGQVKVVLKSESEDDLLVLQERAKSLNLPTHITIAAGRTQIAPNSRTVMALLGEWWKFPISSREDLDKTIVDGAYREFHYAYGHFVTAGSKLVELKEVLPSFFSLNVFDLQGLVCIEILTDKLGPKVFVVGGESVNLALMCV
ncbi:hypothetical protein IFM89_014660 [Coptis chinensis]|uniref:peptidyl-tRNA hydrolase n=1 Tax=Coptis chinensis TaxID=261450 RepID=A0A835LRN0_9MAGN|nr:hypothetical protein IFM89_014660 [Coptis chinensis]